VYGGEIVGQPVTILLLNLRLSKIGLKDFVAIFYLLLMKLNGTISI